MSQGQARVRALVAMVSTVLERRGKPSAVVMHPDDFAALRDGNDQPVAKGAHILGVPIELDKDQKPGEAVAVE